jgi:hypothetical protein
METYRDMLEKLKYHKNNIFNAFLKKNYYPSSEEINTKLALVDSRLALFESYISKPGSYMNIKEINYCFEMIAKDLEILYKVLEQILIEDYSNLRINIEAALTELESKADYYKKRCTEEIHSTTLGTTVFFQANNWNITEENEMNIIDLGTMKLIEGMEISCFANIENINEKDVVFEFDNNDPEKSFLALPYNYNNNSYKVPGEIGINSYPLIMPTTSIVNDYIPIKFEINFDNKYMIAGAEGGMQVSSKKTGETYLYRFANVDNAFVAEEDCFVEFFILDGNKIQNNYMEYSFTEAPVSTNFSLQNGEIPLNKEVVRVSIECQKGLGMFFTVPAGTAYATYEEAIIANKNTLIYKGNWDVRDFVLREYVRTYTSDYRIKVHVKTQDDITSNIESIYIKEVTS